ncbi:MAG TPA: ATP synthase F1 subunit gamma [Rhizomicrobium sp.]|jgi:F-type H+-transporting ATPase subunit gamma|nr:ATP synthase F1 subunit gamma [Rhizomicrobium sp.]
MPSLIDIRRRIRSVKNMQQITKAMKMVSAAKLRRAQERAMASRPYAKMMDLVLRNIAAAAKSNEEAASFPLLAVREEKRVQLILVSSDTGLAGAFNANLFRMLQRFVDERSGADLRVEAIGRKGRDYLRRRNFNVTGEHVGIVEKPNYDQASEIALRFIEQYRNSEIDALYLVVNEFKTVMTPNLVLRKILPVELPAGDNEQIDYIYEQSPDELLRSLLPRYVEMEIYRALLESLSAYHGARMTAMDAASTNAGEMIDKLTLNLNRVRQASITREIIEIVSGAAAL